MRLSRAISFRSGRQGFALLIVLVLLTLAVVLIIGFLGTVTSERKTAQSASSGADAQLLANTAVQVVMGQIRQATQSTANGGTGPATLTWASQPGMIRTYDTNGAEQTNYKLYSSGAMTTNGSLTLAQVSDFDPAWAANTALWTDLNAPVTDATGTLNYPIFNPTGVTAAAPVPSASAAGNPPPALTGIAGLSITSSVPASNDPTTGTTNPAPMPVQWLYELRDGTLAAGTAAGTNTVTVSGASATNPIVGRVAFWTDDETCKININTACGDLWNPGTFTGKISPGSTTTTFQNPGAFWDTPRVSTTYEHDVLAGIQPAQNEYQRYPGLPSTVYLTAAFPEITDRTSLFGLLPRIGATGSSMGGSQTPTGGVTITSGAGTTTSVGLNDQRLYASVDELLFNPSYTSATRNNNISVITKPELEQARFCITANSKAPEVNLFGQPRIAIWPVDTAVVSGAGAATPYGTAYDELMTFCSHLGKPGNKNDYIFQRSAENNGAASTTSDYSGITRNQQLYSYLQALTSNPVPGFGGESFATKYGADRDQILTEIFDYIRSTNLSDSNLAMANRYTQYQPNSFMLPGSGQVVPIQIKPSSGNLTMGFGRFFTVTEVGVMFICCADGGGIKQYPGATAPYNTPPPGLSFPYSGQATPTPDDYQKESNQVWNPNAMTGNRMMGLANLLTTNNPPSLPLTSTQKIIQPIFLIQVASVGEGHLYVEPSYQIVATGLDSVSVSGLSAGMPGSGVLRTNKTWDGGGIPAIQGSSFTRPWGGNGGFRMLLGGQYLPFDTTPNLFNSQTAPSQAVANSSYPFVGKPFVYNSDPSAQGTTMKFRAGTVTLNLYYLTPAPASPNFPSATTLIQTINVDMSQLDAGGVIVVGGVPITVPGLQIPNLVTTSDEPNAVSLNQSPVNDQAESWWSLGVDGAFNSGNGQHGRLYYATLSPNYQGMYIRGGDNLNSLGQTSLPDLGSPTIAQDFDVVRDMVPGYNSTSSPASLQDDIRLVAAAPTIQGSSWVPQRYGLDGSHWIATSFGPPNGTYNMGSPGMDMGGRLVDVSPVTLGVYPTAAILNGWGWPTVAVSKNFNADGTNPTELKSQVTGDFDNGVSCSPDGAFINKADEGDNRNLSAVQQGTGYTADYPYFDNSWNEVPDPSYFSPNRMLPSPGMFGSLSTGVARSAAGQLGLGWQTLLFRPGTESGGGIHPNAGNPLNGPPYTIPPDHLLMDLFWMPTVEPYAISTPFSTSGKINLNYQLAPFTYINRSTALIAAMKAQKLLAVPQNTTKPYKIQNIGDDAGWASTVASNYRFDLNLTDSGGSLTEFLNKFNAGDIFRSPTQICDIDLVPVGQSWTGTTSSIQTQAAAFWAQNALTGDNSRERPYANLYELLTTKSDTYRVHFCVQVLKKVPATPANQWVDGQDVVTGEYRGSSLVERYVDTDDPQGLLPDFTGKTQTLDQFYKLHILSTTKFNP